MHKLQIGQTICAALTQTEHKGQRSSEVEQLFRKQQAVGSIPTVGSIHLPHNEGVPADVGNTV